MKKFVFRLATLRRIKEITEKQQKMELGAAQAVLNAKIQELDELNAERTLMKERFRADIDKGNVQIPRLAHYSQYLQYLKSRIESKQQEVDEAQKKVDTCVAALVVTLNELKVLQNLYDKQLAEHNVQAAKEEEKEIGDMLSYKAAAAPGLHNH